MRWVSRGALTHALDVLKSQGIHGSAATAFIAQKYIGVNDSSYASYISQDVGGQKEQFWVPFLKMADGPNTPRYYKLFDGELSPGGRSDYSHSSVYSVWREERKRYVREVMEWEDARPEEGNYYAKYRPGYIDALEGKLFKSPSSPRIPLIALSVFLQSREGELPEDVDSLEEMAEYWAQRLHLTDEVLGRLFELDSEGWPTGSLSEERLDPAEASRITREQASGVSRGSEAASHSLSAEWPDLAENLDELVGIDEAAARANAALRSGKHIVLIGPPGCGKTALAEDLARGAAAAGLCTGYKLCTATAEWTTFETIGGYMPSRLNTGELVFTPGLVTESMSQGQWLIVDELNRADLDKALGELFTLLSGYPVWLPFEDEKGKRYVLCGPGQEVEGDFHSVEAPRDWRLIATLNTADKASLFQLSYALMRRLAFILVDVLSDEDYRSLIESAWNDSPVEAPQEGLNLLLDIVLPSEGVLSRQGITVGPAIALDIVEYLRARYADVDYRPEDVRVAVLEGLESLAFPQLEGLSLQHEAILDALAEALELDEAERPRLDASLAIWTGYEQS